ncbi:putative AMP-activated kinase, glycogen-binding protein [Helianthus anomalus]
MGNVSVREQAKGKQFDQDECFMECGHAQAHVSDTNSSSSYPAHMLPHHSASHTPQIQRDEYKSMPVVIRWIHGGTEVGIEGSWDNWRTRELLECSGSDFFIVKVLNAGVYHYRFVVDGRWTYASDLPHELDDIGNVFNILDLKVGELLVEVGFPLTQIADFIVYDKQRGSRLQYLSRYSVWE